MKPVVVSASHILRVVGVWKIWQQIACSRSEGKTLNSGRKSQGNYAERKATVVSAIALIEPGVLISGKTQITLSIGMLVRCQECKA